MFAGVRCHRTPSSPSVPSVPMSLTSTSRMGQPTERSGTDPIGTGAEHERAGLRRAVAVHDFGARGRSPSPRPKAFGETGADPMRTLSTVEISRLESTSSSRSAMANMVGTEVMAVHPKRSID